MDFFNDCKTQEEAKSTFKRLCKHFHPDKGGEESLMIELKKQYDAWNPTCGIRTNFDFIKNPGYQFSFNKTSNHSLNVVYEEKINELNGLVHHLRIELDLLRINKSFDRDAYNSEVTLRRKLQNQVDELNEKLELSKRELFMERDKHKNRSLADKIKTVFGYE
jgi:hypothetical protein